MIGYINQKLYSQNQDNYEYFEIETGLIKILGEIGDIKAVPILIQVLQDKNLCQKNPFIQVCAAKSLGQLQDRRETIPLIHILKDNWKELKKQ